jgi:hypothetical protein
LSVRIRSTRSLRVDESCVRGLIRVLRVPPCDGSTSSTPMGVLRVPPLGVLRIPPCDGSTSSTPMGVIKSTPLWEYLEYPLRRCDALLSAECCQSRPLRARPLARHRTRCLRALYGIPCAGSTSSTPMEVLRVPPLGVLRVPPCSSPYPLPMRPKGIPCAARHSTPCLRSSGDRATAHGRRNMVRHVATRCAMLQHGAPCCNTARLCHCAVSQVSC